MPPDSEYSLQDLVDLAGVTPRTIRYYIVQGLLPSPGKAGPGAIYTDGHLNRLRLIKRLQREHLPLAEIRSRLAALDDATVATLVETPASEPPAGSAIDYIRSVLEGDRSPDAALWNPTVTASSSSSPIGPPASPPPTRNAVDLRVPAYRLAEPSPAYAEPPSANPRPRPIPVGPHPPRPGRRASRPPTPRPPPAQAGRAPDRNRPRAPRGGPAMTFTVRPDRRFIRPTYRSNRFVLVEVTAPPARTERVRPPVNLAFVLDRSGSMSGDKIRLAKQAIEEAIARLHDDDRFAIVIYDDHIDVVVPGTLATPDARRTALDRLRADRRPRLDEPRRGLAAGRPAGRRSAHRRGRQPLPPPHRRPRQRRDHRPRRARPARRRAARPRGLHDDLRGRRGLRRGAPPVDGVRRRRPLLLHRHRCLDP